MIALTGYTGFIGQKVLSALNDKPCLLLGRTHFKIDYPFSELDLADIDKANLLESLKPVTTLIHLAARVHVMEELATEGIAEYNAINSQATLTIAIQAAKAGVKRFIFLSTIKVNGEITSAETSFTALDKPAPEGAYGISKAEAEKQLIELGKKTGMEIVIIRPPLVYGEGVKANFASLMNAVANGIPMPFRLIKNNRRSLVSVYNLVDLIKVCIDHPKAANEVFLVSDDHDLSTAQMIVLMNKALGKNNISLPVPLWCFTLVGKLLNKNDVVERLTGSLQLDISFTKTTLGWSPPYSVEHGFRLAAKQTMES